MLSVLSQPIVFCDVETTGGNGRLHRITEIACIRYEDGMEVDRFVSLVNPESPIPFNIQMITGITPALVAGAPTFGQIASALETILEGAIFCAHNVRFDYSFIEAEFARAGYTFKMPKLCTVQISRSLYPTHRGHGLSQIIERFSFTCDARHRALGDTLVLVQFAKHLDTTFTVEKLALALKKHSTNITLPPNAKSSLLRDVPHEPGVYFFYGKNDELLYVGKSVNIYTRLLSHFSNANHNTRSANIWNETYRIDTKTTASDLGASLLELQYIKNLQPVYNRRSRKTRKMWGLFKEAGAEGYHTLHLRPFTDLALDTKDNVYSIFKTKMQAVSAVQGIVKEKGLCPILLGIESGKGPCFSHQLEICQGACVGKMAPVVYNILLEQAFVSRKVRTWPYPGAKTITHHNPKNNKTEEYVIYNWLLTDATLLAENEIEDFLAPQTTFDYEMYKVLAKYF